MALTPTPTSKTHIDVDLNQQPTTSRKLLGKVLIVEDDSVVGEWLKRKLERAGLTCFLANSRLSAEAILASDQIHAVITDVFLEDGAPGGLQLVHQLSSSGIPVIVISSRADLKIAKEAMNHGAQYLLEKPFGIDELLTALEKLWEEPRGHMGILERFMDLNSLTNKEKEIVRLLLKGLSNKEVAQISGNTEKTIKFHLTTIYQKCSVASRCELFNAVFPT